MANSAYCISDIHAKCLMYSNSCNLYEVRLYEISNNIFIEEEAEEAEAKEDQITY